MSSAQGEYPVGDSPAYAWLSSLAHAGAAASLVLTGLDTALVAALWVVLALCAVRDVRITGLWRRGSAVRSVRVRGGQWFLVRHDGRVYGPARPLSVRAGCAALVLALRADAGGVARIIVPADAVRGDDLRRLRAHALAALDGTAS